VKKFFGCENFEPDDDKIKPFSFDEKRSIQLLMPDFINII